MAQSIHSFASIYAPTIVKRYLCLLVRVCFSPRSAAQTRNSDRLFNMRGNSKYANLSHEEKQRKAQPQKKNCTS